MRHLAAFGSLLLISTALVAPAALAETLSDDKTAVQSPPDVQRPPPAPNISLRQQDTRPDAPEQEVEISGPGASVAREIVVTGTRVPNAMRRTAEVVSVLSAEEIARAGEGDIAGALQRVTGLSVVGGRFVYVRGLGERYSLALLNGSQLPSPEPLRRVVPLDLFPTSIIASSVVQKSYSVAYPGEFGGGVINLTTRAVPRESFLNIGTSIGGDSETTFQLGYTYFGSPTDWTSFDSGVRSVPAPLQAALDSGNLVVVGPNFSRTDIQDITASLVNGRTTLVQRNFNIPPNAGLNFSGGTSFDALGATLGLIAAAGYSNSWQTRGGQRQTAAGVTPVGGVDTLQADIDYRFLNTQMRTVVNGLLGLGAEFGGHRLRWTNLYIRDVLKEAQIQQGINEINVGSELVNISSTGWFERQLFSTQGVAELRFGGLGIDLRAAYAKSDRRSPYERQIGYRFDPRVNDFVNDLRSNGQFARIAFSDLNDTVLSGGADFTYRLPRLESVAVSAGYAYYRNERDSVRRDFRYNPVDALPIEVAQQRPDFLLSDFNVFRYGILLTDVSGSAGVAAYVADLDVHAGYAQIEAEPLPGVRIQGGVRREKGRQSVTPLDLFGLGGPDIVPTRIDRSYWLPAATVTWTVAEDMQLRAHASRTIARPQFRELAPQQYLDTETGRTFFGNQFLVDSELTNAEARWEYYFARDQRFSLAGFWKRIERPIEAIAFQQGGTFFTTFANAPKAQLYGAEFELQKYFPLENLLGGPVFTPRRGVLVANYTFSDSEIQVSPGDTSIPVGSGGTPVPAEQVFIGGTPLTGQSRHIVNLQLGLENVDRLSQQTLLLTYASPRVTNRGPSGQPDLYERPGLRLDFVMREAVRLFGINAELKFEARNLLGEDYQEYQELGESRILNNSYRIGRSFSLGLSATF